MFECLITNVSFVLKGRITLCFDAGSADLPCMQTSTVNEQIPRTPHPNFYLYEFSISSCNILSALLSLLTAFPTVLITPESRCRNILCSTDHLIQSLDRLTINPTLVLLSAAFQYNGIGESREPPIVHDQKNQTYSCCRRNSRDIEFHAALDEVIVLARKLRNHECSLASAPNGGLCGTTSHFGITGFRGSQTIHGVVQVRDEFH